MTEGQGSFRMSVTLMLSIGWLMLPGCNTVREHAETGEPVIRPGIQVPFAPVRSGAPIQWESGPYSTLFSSGSWAAWVGPDSDAASPAWAAALTLPPDRFALLECRLISSFADQSMAYDAVGLRGVEVWLETPDGRHILPVQVIRDGHLDEQLQGALRVFARRSLLVFPREEIYFVVNRDTGPMQEMRLCLQAAQTLFSCRWSGETPVVNTPVPLKEHPATQTVHQKLRQLWDKSGELSHQFD